MRKKRVKKNKKRSNYFLEKFTTKLLLLAAFIVIIGLSKLAYFVFYQPNVHIQEEDSEFIYIPTNSTFNDVIKILVDNNIIINSESFGWTAERMNYKNNIHPGRYRIQAGMSNIELIRLLRAGLQEPLRISITKYRTKKNLVNYISKKLEADKKELLAILNDKFFLREYGFTPDNVMSVFLQNTYEFYWNTSARGVFNRMYKEFNRFWTDKRLSKAVGINLTPIEVIILASIVEEETLKDDEKPTIAGVYLNRLKKKWKLQADPTVKFAVNNFKLRRITNRHIRYNSPYNTYKYIGLPPGPICLPSPNSINAVLDPYEHNYMYFCASIERKGYHHFSFNLKQHMAYARKYQRELNRRKIW